MKTLQQMVKDLKEAHVTQGQIAKAIGVSQPTVSRMNDGTLADVMVSIAAKLARFHAKRCGKKP